MSQPDAPWAPTHIFGEDLYIKRMLRGDNYIYPMDVAPERCPIDGAKFGTCVDNHGTFVPVPHIENIIELPEA